MTKFFPTYNALLGITETIDYALLSAHRFNPYTYNRVACEEEYVRDTHLSLSYKKENAQAYCFLPR